MKKEEIRVRDPYVLADEKSHRYYLYGTTDLGEGYGSFPRFSVYVSDDLENFEGPFCVFDGAKTGFWGTRDFWAAEVHPYRGAYYLFGSMKAEGHPRATQILKADSPMGPFAPISEEPQTPAEWECLDGTFWEEDGKPYLVFCHEWLQCVAGEIWAVELTPDLSARAGEPFLLIRSSDYPELCAPGGAFSPDCRVTDGPFLRREDGKIKMIWSSFTKDGYAVLEETADSLRGKWSHSTGRFDFDGGHAMFFTDFAGRRYVSLHAPNTPPAERPVFIEA